MVVVPLQVEEQAPAAALLPVVVVVPLLEEALLLAAVHLLVVVDPIQTVLICLLFVPHSAPLLLHLQSQ